MTAPCNSQEKCSSSNNVRVVSRIRPLAKYEIEKGCRPVVAKVPSGVNHACISSSEALQINSGDRRWFELDAVLDETSTQEDVYIQSGAYKAVTKDLFQGFNCTILAYGQTGSGKTFTMGTAAKTTSGGGVSKTDGVIPRACYDLFENIVNKCDSNAHVELSYMEVYNEEIRDLLCQQQHHHHQCSSAKKRNQQLRIRETLNGEVYVSGLQSRTVSSPSDIGVLMEEASSRRVVASTKMNAVSSRSHAICVLKIKGVLEDSTKFQSKLTLVDLAGSERIKKTQAQGSRAQEGISINKGLFVLGQVVSALSEQRPKYKRKPPFRDSKLTRLLQDSLGGNSRTIMIACCSPADFNLEETINTLRYATQARNIKNSATANVVQPISQEEAMKLQRENDLLRSQVAELQYAVTRLSGDVSTDDVERSLQLIQAETQRMSVQFMERSKSERSDCSSSDSAFPRSPLSVRSVNSGNSYCPSTPEQNKTYEELAEENFALEAKLHQAEGEIRASMSQSVVELPALKVKVKMLEEELRDARSLESETECLKRELEEARADRESALRAAQQMADFVDNQECVRRIMTEAVQQEQLRSPSGRSENVFVIVMLCVLKELVRCLSFIAGATLQVVRLIGTIVIIYSIQSLSSTHKSPAKDVIGFAHDAGATKKQKSC